MRKTLGTNLQLWPEVWVFLVFDRFGRSSRTPTRIGVETGSVVYILEYFESFLYAGVIGYRDGERIERPLEDFNRFLV